MKQIDNHEIERKPTYPYVGIVVLNWNGKKYLKECLSSIEKLSYPRKTIIVVDNNSHDGSQEYIRKNYKKIILLKNKSNLGWSKGNNRGIKHALSLGVDCVFILNNDTILLTNTLDMLVSELYKNINIGIVGPKIYLLTAAGKNKKTISFAGGYFTKNRYFAMHSGNNKEDSGQYDQIKDTEFITGAAMLVKKEVFQEVGYFNEDYFIYYEDTDLCTRVSKKKGRIRFVPSAIVWHAFSGTVKLGSAFQHYYTTRNHYLFVERNAPFTVKLREFCRTPKTILEFIKSNDPIKRKYSLYGIRDYFLRNFGKRTYW